MVTLDSASIILLILVVTLISIFLIALLLILRTIFTQKGVLAVFGSLNTHTIIAIVTAGSVLLILILVSLLIVFATIDISSTLESLKTCSSLKVKNLLMASGQDICEEITVNDRSKIENLAAVMANSDYKRDIKGGVLATRDAIDIYVYKNGTQVGHFSIVGGSNLFTDTGSYECTHGLLYKVRETVGVESGLKSKDHNTQ